LKERADRSARTGEDTDFRARSRRCRSADRSCDQNHFQDCLRHDLFQSSMTERIT
jgi:hypothetical protein